MTSSARPASTGSRPRLVAVGWYVPGTGLTRVLEGLLSRLGRSWRIDVAGVGYDGPPVDAGGFVVHPTDPSGRDTFGAYAALRLIDELEPDVVLCFHDLWILPRYLKLLGPARSRTRLVAYLPVDGNLAPLGPDRVDPELARPLLGFDQVIVYTGWARSQVEAAWDLIGAGQRPEVEVLEHGVDQRVFFPDPELVAAGFDPAARVAARRRVLPHLDDPEHALVVLNPSRPALRKRLDLTLEGFARFAEGKPPNVCLCLHQAITDPEHDLELGQSIQRLGLEPRLIRNPLGDGVASDADLARLYQACDVGLSTSMGEGWGLVSFEHGATGGAQVVPDHSACADLWTGRAEMIPVARRLVPRFSPLELAEVDPAGVAAALERLYREPELLRQRSRAAWQLAQDPRLRWSALAGRLGMLLGRALQPSPTAQMRSGSNPAAPGAGSSASDR